MNRKKYFQYLTACMLLVSVCCVSCSDDSDDFKVGTLAVPSVSDIAITSFVVNGNVPTEVTERGVVYGTTIDPTVDGDKKAVTSDEAAFTVTIEGLEDGTVYYVRTYAISGSKTVYSENVWPKTLDSPVPMGEGTEASPYKIKNATQLAWISQNDTVGVEDKEPILDIWKHKFQAVYRLAADIDMTGVDFWPIATYFKGSNSSITQYLPNVIPFSGKIYGDGHKIENLAYNDSACYVGLFGVLAAGAYIENLHIVDGSITYRLTKTASTFVSVGAIAGIIIVKAEDTEGVTIKNCSNTASVNDFGGSSNTGHACGGLIGQILNDSPSASVTISSSYNKGNVRGGFHQGGIVGRAFGIGTIAINDCYSTGNQSKNDGTDGGVAYDGNPNRINAATHIGGIVGILDSPKGSITNCYASGTISNFGGTNTTGSHYSGGIASRVTNGNLSSCVALQTSIASTPAEGSTSVPPTHRVRGFNTAPSLTNTLTNNYANAEMTITLAGVTAEIAEVGTDLNDGADVTLTDAKTQAFYTGLGWNFDNTWTIKAGTAYPTLKWE
jgi:hypothetical protein